MTTFALVHGAWHGAWCWESLTSLLEAEGHEVVAVDLPSEDTSATFETYADHVCSALRDCRHDDVVVVGHSLGGHTIPLVAARRPVRHLVYLCALVPDVRRSLAEQLRDDVDMMNPLYQEGLERCDGGRSVRWIDDELAKALMYGDCDEPSIQAAIRRLRPQSRSPYAKPFSLNEFPSVPASYIVCHDDLVVMPAWSRRVAREPLNADLIELAGSHSPFLSRPGQLADVLLRIAAG